jgi:hypothetical protein
MDDTIHDFELHAARREAELAGSVAYAGSVLEWAEKHPAGSDVRRLYDSLDDPSQHDDAFRGLLERASVGRDGMAAKDLSEYRALLERGRRGDEFAARRIQETPAETIASWSAPAPSGHAAKPGEAPAPAKDRNDLAAILDGVRRGDAAAIARLQATDVNTIGASPQ